MAMNATVPNWNGMRFRGLSSFRGSSAMNRLRSCEFRR
jgi:hypothetical protein